MEITQLNLNTEKISDDKAKKLYSQIQELIEKLNEKKIPSQAISFINKQINGLNVSTLTNSLLHKHLKNTQTAIIKKLEADHKIVPKNYYRNLWTALGMATLGLPFGTVLGLLMGNIGLMALGLPLGLAIGVGIGTSLDKKALQEGRQIDIELKL